MKKLSAIKNDLFASHQRESQIDHMGDPLAGIEACIDFKALAASVDQVAPRGECAKGGRPAYPTETMVRILVLKRLNNHSDERMEFLLLDRLSYQRFCGLTHSLKVPDRTTIWSFENRIGEVGAMALFEGVSRQLLKRAPRLKAYFVEPRLDSKVSTHISAISEPNSGHFWSVSS
jgi:hypothetical protein